MWGVSVSQSCRPFLTALAAALAQSGDNRSAIASEALVTTRTLQRWIRGDVVPSVEEWSRVLELCGTTPATSLLVAAAGRPDLIGTSTHAYINGLLEHLMTIIAAHDDEGQDPPDPRAARRDAELLNDKWRETNQRRRDFIDAQLQPGGSVAVDHGKSRSQY